METISDVPKAKRLFNSDLEIGTRALIILNAAYPLALDLKRLTWFDHLVVHTADIGGPSSLHPALPSRTGEMLVRRRLVEQSLMLMQRLHLVDVIADDRGISYQAAEDAPAVISLMRTKYSLALKERANWLVAELAGLGDDDLTLLMNARIDRWASEFQGETGGPVSRL
jgi:hypothetical protein